eukprot:21972_1
MSHSAKKGGVTNQLELFLASRPSADHLLNHGILKATNVKYESQWDEMCQTNYSELPIGIKSIIIMHCKCCPNCFNEVSWYVFLCKKCATERGQELAMNDIFRIYPKYGGAPIVDKRYGTWSIFQCETSGWADYSGAHGTSYDVLLVHLGSRCMCKLYFSSADRSGTCDWDVSGTELHCFDKEKMHCVQATEFKNNEGTPIILNLKTFFKQNGFNYNHMLWICTECDGVCHCANE